MGVEGFEPSKAEPPGLQPGPFGRFGTRPCSERDRIEKGSARCPDPLRQDCSYAQSPDALVDHAWSLQILEVTCKVTSDARLAI